ncbi:hypothetical protein RSOL_248980 [Rhizoctonia solani AG-3 Rhs1AP]|uniref:Uncharacterized protein n=1 Tax=Rhizoctonia solani AG-3 Rhs1AP TaxID=1086054 RepID=A0A0A1UHN1_9AGAM|nr:hypothetical protein RSOL_248980 [Rhizoctonia solani AG-3 Rhs1AP]
MLQRTIRRADLHTRQDEFQGWRRVNVGPDDYSDLCFVLGRFDKRQVVHSKLLRVRVLILLLQLQVAASVRNTPKHLARFEFMIEKPSDPNSPRTISVYPSLSDSPTPEFSLDPIFRARMVPSRYLPSFPLNLSNIPRALFDSRVIQPPLNGPIGTEKWISVEVENSGYAQVMYLEPGLEGGRYGDGIRFPDFKPMSVGLWCPKVSVPPF